MGNFFKNKDRKERRISQRIDPEDICLVEFSKPGQIQRKLGELKDVSLNGIRFASNVRLDKNQPLQIYLYFPKNFPGTRWLSIKATVIRMSKPSGRERYRIGCHLHHENETTRERIRQFMFWLESHPQ